MPESNNLVVPAAVVTTVISLTVAVRARMAAKKEQDNRQKLAIELAVTECQRAVLAKMVSDRNIKPTQEEAELLAAYTK
jgi:hypothetical protein